MANSILIKACTNTPTAPKYSGDHILVKVTVYEVIPLDENNMKIVRHRHFWLTKALPQLMPIKVLQGIPELKECVNKASDYDSLIVLKVVGINAEI